MEKNNDYHISFFKPTTPQAKSNRNMVIFFVCLWAIAIFGFQILLKILEKPVKEKTLIQFEEVWENVKKGNATDDELKTFAGTSLSVLSKVIQDTEHRAALDNGLSWAVNQLVNPSDRNELENKVREFEETAAGITDIRDKSYIEAKELLGLEIAPIIGIEKSDVRITILPLELKSSQMGSFTEENKKTVESAMSLYLTHNQSVLTDTKFLGFPFHYFYTAILLLVLFVGICWLYCVRTDRINSKLNIAD